MRARFARGRHHAGRLPDCFRRFRPADHSDTKLRTTATSPQKRALQPLKQPNWEQCYAMSR